MDVVNGGPAVEDLTGTKPKTQVRKSGTLWTLPRVMHTAVFTVYSTAGQPQTLSTNKCTAKRECLN